MQIKESAKILFRLMADGRVSGCMSLETKGDDRMQITGGNEIVPHISKRKTDFKEMPES